MQSQLSVPSVPPGTVCGSKKHLTATSVVTVISSHPQSSSLYSSMLLQVNALTIAGKKISPCSFILSIALNIKALDSHPTSLPPPNAKTLKQLHQA